MAAARKALEIHRNPGSIADVFKVVDRDRPEDGAHLVDLGEIDEMGQPFVEIQPGPRASTHGGFWLDPMATPVPMPNLQRTDAGLRAELGTRDVVFQASRIGGNVRIEAGVGIFQVEGGFLPLWSEELHPKDCECLAAFFSEASGPDNQQDIRRSPTLLEALKGNGSALERYKAGDSLLGEIHGAMNDQAGAAIHDVLKPFKEDPSLDFAGVRFVRGVWENDDQTVVEIARVQVGYAGTGEVPIEWVDWDEAPGFMEDDEARYNLAMLGLHFVDYHTRTYEVLI